MVAFKKRRRSLLCRIRYYTTIVIITVDLFYFVDIKQS